MPETSRAAEGIKIRELFFAASVDRTEMDALALQGRNAASGQNVDRKVQRESAGMKQVKRPEVNSAAGEVGTAGRLRDDGGSSS